MKTLALERYFSFSYIEENFFLYIEEKVHIQRLLYRRNLLIYRKKRHIQKACSIYNKVYITALDL